MLLFGKPHALAVFITLWGIYIGRASEPLTAIRRGEKALLTRAFLPPAWSLAAFRNLPRTWEKPDTSDKDREIHGILAHYGLHAAPYSNGGLPMGLRESTFLWRKGLTNDCLLCHGGSIAGKSYVGLGNSSLDYQALFEDLNRVEGRPASTPFVFSNVRGTTEAGAMAVFLLSLRDPDLNLRKSRLNLDLHDDMCEDVPAWWLLKKKKTMYYTGSSDARSVRSLMQFMLSPLVTGSAIKNEEATFRDVQAYLLSLSPPPYPFDIDRRVAAEGEKIFLRNCARCHGTYGTAWTYPNKIIPLETVRTDPARALGISNKAGNYYNQSWFAKEKTGWLTEEYSSVRNDGYQAPPLDGIWATAPYFHNGSVATIYQVLNSKSRPRIFTRSYRTDVEDYDTVQLGWKVKVLDENPATQSSAFERRKIYDTRLTGRGNQGHTFGDNLTDQERWAVLEYLKTL